MRGRFHCVLSGSSELLRKLITATFTRPEAHSLGLVHYHLVGLNATKFPPFTILPFLRESEFCSLLDYVKAGLLVDSHVNSWELYYWYSGGLPGLLTAILLGGNSLFGNQEIELRDIQRKDPVGHEFLLNLMTATNSWRQRKFDCSCIYDEKEGFDWMIPVSVDMVDRSVSSELLYNLADGGYIQYNDVSVPPKVGFYSPQIYLGLLAAQDGSLSREELMALKHPHSNYERLAEKIVAKLLMRCPGFWSRLGCSGVHSTAFAELSDLVLPGENEGPSGRIPPKGILFKELLGLKEKRDCLGATFAIVVEQRVLRFQLKLGASSLNESDFESIEKKFDAGLPLAQKAYAKLGLELDANCNYLITTRPFRREDDVVKDRVRVIDSTFLHQVGVWPDVVQHL